MQNSRAGLGSGRQSICPDDRPTIARECSLAIPSVAEGVRLSGTLQDRHSELCFNCGPLALLITLIEMSLKTIAGLEAFRLIESVNLACLLLSLDLP